MILCNLPFDAKNVFGVYFLIEKNWNRDEFAVFFKYWLLTEPFLTNE